MLRIVALICLFTLAAVGKIEAKPIRGLKVELGGKTVSYQSVAYLQSVHKEGQLLRRGLAAVAAKDLGVTSYSPKALEMKRLAGIHKNAPWCAAGTSKWLIEAGYGITPRGRVVDLEKEVKRIAKSSSPNPGAVVFFRWSHVGVLDHVTADGRFVVIQANCSGAVRVRTHTRQQIRAFYTL